MLRPQRHTLDTVPVFERCVIVFERCVIVFERCVVVLLYDVA